MAAGIAVRARERALTVQGLSPDLSAATGMVALAAGYYLIGSTPISLALLAALAYLVWRRSDVAVALIPLSVPFYMLPKQLHLVRHLEFSLGETAILLCAAVVLAQQALTVRTRLVGVPLWRHFVPASPFERWALAFLVAAGLATLGARFHDVALRYYRWEIVEPLLFYWLILQRLRGAKGAAWLALSVVAAGVLLALLGLGQILLRPDGMAIALNVPGKPHLVRAVYGNQNNLALYLDRAIPMALALLLLPGWLGALFPAVDRADPAPGAAGEDLSTIAPGLSVHSHGGVTLPDGADGYAPVVAAGSSALAQAVRRRWQVALALASVLMLYILYRTDSRGGELAVAACGAALFVYWQRRRPWVLAAGGALVLVAGYVARHRIYDTLTQGHGLTDNARVSVWLSALRMLGDNPYAGVGPDNFLYYYSDDSTCAPGHIAAHYYQQTALGNTPVNFERCISHPHNLFLDFWLSTGFLGFVAAMALLVLFVVLGLRAFRGADARWRGPLLAALVAMLAFAVHGQVDNSYFLQDLSVLFWLCFGIVALWQREEQVAGVPA